MVGKRLEVDHGGFYTRTRMLWPFIDPKLHGHETGVDGGTRGMGIEAMVEDRRCGVIAGSMRSQHPATDAKSRSEWPT